MLRQLSRQEETNCSLNLPRGDGRPFVVMGELRSLSSNSLKQVVDETVHDAHGFGRYTSIRVDLLQHLVDVDCVGLFPLSLALLLVALGHSLGGLARLGSSFSRGFGRHFKNFDESANGRMQ